MTEFDISFGDDTNGFHRQK